MRRLWVSLVAIGVLAVAAVVPTMAQDIISVQIDEVEDSGMTGSASFSSEDGQTAVSIIVTQGVEEGSAHPVHIHEGSCDDLGDVVYPLEDIVDGESESTVDAPMAEIMTGEYAVNAHLSEDEIDTHVLCGDIPEAEIAVADEGEGAEDDDDGAADDEAEDADDAEQVVPETGAGGGAGTEPTVVVMLLGAGAMLGVGLLARRHVRHT